MNLYLISQNENNDYDTYDSAVVCAETEEEARMIHPSACNLLWDGKAERFDSWCDAKYVDVELIGAASGEYQDKGVVCASFNAG